MPHKVCDLSVDRAKAFGTHSSRRGAALTARAQRTAPREMRAFAGVSSESWEDWYGDSIIPAERRAIASLLASGVRDTSAGCGTTPRARPANTAAVRQVTICVPASGDNMYRSARRPWYRW